MWQFLVSQDFSRAVPRTETVAARSRHDASPAVSGNQHYHVLLHAHPKAGLLLGRPRCERRGARLRHMAFCPCRLWTTHWVPRRNAPDRSSRAKTSCATLHLLVRGHSLLHGGQFLCRSAFLRRSLGGRRTAPSAGDSVRKLGLLYCQRQRECSLCVNGLVLTRGHGILPDLVRPWHVAHPLGTECGALSTRRPLNLCGHRYRHELDLKFCCCCHLPLARRDAWSSGDLFAIRGIRSVRLLLALVADAGNRRQVSRGDRGALPLNVQRLRGSRG
mmetsp:Transcript_16354/g.49798  ORF Transcript_16354/g.49798 Transcript_16354/m.49798 type:complete len:274 (+) Transcript_16354:1334-2155(+)